MSQFEKVRERKLEKVREFEGAIRREDLEGV